MLKIFNNSPKKIYLDYNSSTPILPEVIKYAEPFYNNYYYNPSAKYALPLKEYLVDAKSKIMNLLNAMDGKIVFYNSGTEAISSFLQGIAWNCLYTNNPKRHIISSSIEHDATLNTLEHLKILGFKIDLIDVDKNGVVDIEKLEKTITKDTLLVSIMHVNNETGIIQPIKNISKITKKNNVFFHCDGIASVGKTNIDIQDLGVDAYTITAHKFYGPKGSAISYINNNINLKPIVIGSKQEYGLKGGTENVAGLVCLTKALEIICNSQNSYIKKETEMLSNFEENLKKNIDDFVINSHKDYRVCNTLNVSFAKVKSADIIKKLSDKGVCVSLGAASVGDEFSHVIKALGVDSYYAKGTIRFSIGKFTTQQELDDTVIILKDIIQELRK